MTWKQNEWQVDDAVIQGNPEDTEVTTWRAKPAGSGSHSPLAGI